MPKLDRNAAFNEAFGSEPKLDRAEAEKLAEDGGGLADAGREFVRGTYQLADSAMGMIDRGFVGDLMRAVKGKPTSRDVDPIVTNFLRLPKAEQERISSEYLNAGTPMQDAQAYFKNAADEWAKKRSPSLQAAEDYTQQGDGVVDIVTRYAEEPSALAGALIRNLPQMLPMLAVRKAPISAQASIGTVYQGEVGAQQSRDQSLTDAKQSGASATDTVNAAQTAEDVGGAVSTFAGLFGARGDVAALNAITGRSLAPILAGGKKELLKQPALNAVEEFIDEAGSPLGANIGAQKTYDPTRDTMQNVVNQGTHGALVGGPMGIAQGASMAFGKREQTPETAAANADALVSAINNAVGPIVQTRDTLKTQVDDLANQVKAFDEASANGQLNAADISRKQALLQELAAKQTELSAVETQAQDAAISASNDALKQYAQAGEVPDFNAMGERLGINPDDLSSLYDQHSTSIKQQQAATDTRNKVASLIEANDTEGAQAFLEQNGFKQDQADVIMGDAMKSIAAKNKAINDQKAAEAKQQAKLDAAAKLRAERDSELATILKTKPDASFANDVLPILQKKYKLQSGSEALAVWNEAKKQSKAAPVDQQADAAEVTDEERLNAKKAIYSAYKDTGYPDDSAAVSVSNVQNKANEKGVPFNVWRAEGGTLAVVPASQKSPVTNGKLIGTIHPESKATADEQTPAIDNTQAATDELAQHIETKTRPDFIGLGKKYSAKPLDLDKQYREMLRVKKEQSKTAPPVAPVEDKKPISFTTAKGSSYSINKDGTTTRNKKYRPEHGEKEQGIQDKSEVTIYVDEAGANALSELQAISSESTGRVIEKHSNGQWGIKYTKGKDAGKFERRTMVSSFDKPDIGLTPVELWDGGKTVHFGNKITEVSYSNDNKAAPIVQPPPKQKAADRPIDPEKDSLLVALAKLGGLSRDEAKSHRIDPAYLNHYPVFGKKLFRTDGKSFDSAAEALAQDNYPVFEDDQYNDAGLHGGNGRSHTGNALLLALTDALNGKDVGTPQYYEAKARKAYDEAQEEARLEDLFNGKGTGKADWLDDVSDAIVDELIENPSTATQEVIEAIQNDAGTEAQDVTGNSQAETQPTADETSPPVSGQETTSQSESGGRESAGSSQANPINVDSATIGTGSQDYANKLLAPAKKALDTGNYSEHTTKTGQKIRLVIAEDNKSEAVIFAFDEKGNRPVATMTYSKYEENGTRFNPTIEVDKSLRRQGIATAMYKLAEQNGGLIPDLNKKGQARSDDGQKFRESMVAPEAQTERKEAQAEPAPQEQIIEHVTAKGKTIRGVVRMGITKEEAKLIDPYTFAKDGGFFIREKYLTQSEPVKTEDKQELPQDKPVKNNTPAPVKQPETKQPETKPRDKSAKKLIGKNPEGKDLYEDGNGIRFYDNGNGFLVGESVAIKLGNVANPYDTSNRTDEHRTVEEVAARQPKPQPKEEKPAPIKQPTKKESLLIQIDDELDSALDDLAAIFKEQGKRLSSGVDPVIMGKVLAIGIKASTLYLAKGAVKFSIWAENMIASLSSKGVAQDLVEPYLKGLYAASKMQVSPEIRKQMDKEDDVYDFDFATLNAKQEQTAKQPRTSLPEGWNGSINGMAIKKGEDGGIIDKPFNTVNEWFVIPHNDLLKPAFKDKTFTSQDEAFDAFEKATNDLKQKKAPVAIKTLTDLFYDHLKKGTLPKDNVALRKMVAEFDGKEVDNYRLKAAQEELEAAMASYARDVVAAGNNDATTFNQLLDTYQNQPNLNIRTSTSVENQAYSTPAPLAFIAARLAGIGRNTTVYEPTAGNGMLLLTAKPSNAIANELEDTRFANLKAQGFKTHQGDAVQAIANGVVKENSQDAIITNPPFGSIKDKDGNPTKVQVDGYKLGKIDHLIAAEALRAMKDKGRATLIIGADKVAGGISTDDRIFFNWLYSHYNVTGHFELDGKLYNRQGAGWPVRVITIDGRKASDNVSPQVGTIQRYNTWEKVYEQYQLLASANSGREPTDSTSGTDLTQRNEQSPTPKPNDTKGASTRSPSGGRSTTGTSGVSGQSTRNVSDRNGAKPDELRGSDNVQRLDERTNAQDNLAIGDNRDTAKTTEPNQGSTGRTDATKPDGSVLTDTDNAFQVKYTPHSSRKDEGVLVPINMKQPMADALSILEDRVGDVDKYAAKELGYKSVDELHDALMGLQVDSVASAIYQMSEKGKGVIIADQTGIGKGRQAAAIIRWAKNKGLTPVFVTVKPSLFTDMYGDLADIGSNDISPFIMNLDASISSADGKKLFGNKSATHKKNIESIIATGQLPEGSNALFLTYSQINTANNQRKALNAIAHNAIFILDESHNAGGSSSTGLFVRNTLKEVKGVVYLSATFAKRPDNMPLYFKTDMGESVSDTGQLSTIMAQGGLPLQTIVSNALVKAGQMFRRERSYNGVSIVTKVDSANKVKHEKLSDKTTTALRAITHADSLFHTLYFSQLEKEMEARGESLGEAGNNASESVNHTEFSSVVHNFIRQMLLGLKADTAANEAIAALKNGEKPLIALENTMGSFLNEYADANSLGDGDSLGDFGYRNVLSRALERSRYIIHKNAQGEEERMFIQLSELDPKTRAAYDQAQKIIDKLDIDIPVSPLDWIRHRIQQAGYSVAEITGRDMAVDYSTKTPTLTKVPLIEQNDKVNTTRMFNDGRLDAVILNVSGSTGISLHASEKFKDQRQRHMIVAQPAQDINIFMQMLGRIHRTGQVVLPKYTILNVDLAAEKRPTALLNKKMKSLNANTSSNTESATSIKSVDMLNKYGDQVINAFLRENPDIAVALRIGFGEDDSVAELDIARKATGRMALLPVSKQMEIYNEVEEQYNSLISYLDETGQNDLEPRTIDYAAEMVKESVMVEATDDKTPFGQEAVYGEYKVKAQGKPMTFEQMKELATKNLDGHTNGKAHAKAFIEQQQKAFPLMNADTTLLIGDELDAVTSAMASFNQGADYINSHYIGSAWTIDIKGDIYNAVVTNIRTTHKGKGNPLSASKIQFTLAVNGALRSITIPATEFKRIEVGQTNGDLRQIFAPRANDQDIVKIITGNLLAGYANLVGMNGSIISFTKKDGSIEQGILLPKKFDFKENARHDFQLKTARDAVAVMNGITDTDFSRFGIASRIGDIRITRQGDNIKIVVPKSKATGGKWFLDKELTAIVGDFVSNGNMMQVIVRGRDKEKALSVILKKSPLYVLPSMAEEARAIVNKDAKQNGVNENGNAYEVRQPASPSSRMSQINLFASPLPSPTVDDNQRQAAGNFAVNIESVEQGRIKSVPSKVTDSKGAASILREFGNRAQETLLILMLDENNKPIEVARHSIGNATSSIVDVGIAVGSIASNPKARTVYFGHNHPSGNAEPSQADKNITEKLKEFTDLIGVNFGGHVVIGENDYSLIKHKFDVTENIDYQPATNSRNSVPVTERIITARSKDKPMEASSPQAAESIVEKIDQDGLILLNSQNKVMGFIAITPQEMANLKSNPALVRKMFSDWSKAGADSTIIVTTSAQNEAADNISNALMSTGTMRVLDHFYKNSSGKYLSRRNLATFRPQEGSYFSRESAWYFSPLRRAVEGIKQEVAPSSQWIATIAKQAGVKSDELSATGLNEWLELQDGKITKAQILDYLKGNSVEVRDVVVGIDESEINNRIDIVIEDEAINADYKNGNYWADEVESMRDKYEDEGYSDDELLDLAISKKDRIARVKDDSFEVMEIRDDILEQYNDQEKATAFDEFTLHDGENYKEMTVNLVGEAKYKVSSAHSINYEADTNQLVRVRFNERTDENGNKVMFLEEIQSDWGQKGKKEGFDNREKFDRLLEKRHEALNDDEYNAIQEELNKLQEMGGGVPSSPLVQKTDTWVALGLKRAIRYAAENGFDRIAWTTGKQQADRYDLSKRVDSIKTQLKKDGEYFVYLVSNGRTIANETIAKNKLADNLGVELADKIINSPTNANGWTGQVDTWEGVDLEVGGTGMKAFYDNIVPKVANEIIKKLGGNKVNITTFDDIGAQQGFDITESMRDMAMAGLPLFSENKNGGGLTTDQVRTTLVDHFGEKTVKALEDKGLIVIYANVSAVPKQFDAKQGDQGFYDPNTGITHLIADNLNPETVLPTMLHEMGGHAGFQALLGAKLYDALMGTFNRLVAAGNPIAIEAQRRAEEAETNKSTQEMEKLPYLLTVAQQELQSTNLQKSAITKLIDRIISAVRAFAFEKLGVRLELTPSDMVALAERMIKALASAKATTTKGSEAQVQFSRATNGQPSPSPTNPKLDRLIHGIGPGEKLFNALAQPIHKWLDDHSSSQWKLVNNMPPAFKQMMREYLRDQKASEEQTKNIIENGIAMSADERNLLSDVLEKMVASGTNIPEHIVQVATAMRAALSSQTDELVRLGMLSEGSAERWRDTYLPRLYDKAAKDPINKALAKRLNIVGDHLKGRGIFREVEESLEAKYEKLGWENRGKGKKGHVIMWRDYTPEERVKMGEIRDALHRFATGFLGTQRDIATGRLLEKIADNTDLASATPVAGWTLVPTATIKETGGVKRYGKLSGMYVHPDVWENTKHYIDDRDGLMEFYRQTLSVWKQGKTALNVVAHMNNVVSNAVMVTAAGANMADVARGYDSIMKEDQYYKEAKELGMLASGHFTGDIRDYFGGDIQDATTPSNLVFKAFKAAWRNKGFEFMRKMYDAEDQLFRMSLYRKARELGATQAESIDYAETFMFNYADLPAGIKKIRDFGLPFISYTYKAVPAVTRLAFTQPHRVLALVGMVYAFNAIAYAMLGADADEDKERKNLPDYMQGYSAWGVPKLVRLPWNDGEKAAFLDIYRWAPLGDFFAIGNRTGGADMPTWAMMSGPYWSFYNTMIQNRNGLTGKNYLEDTDTDRQVFFKRMKFGLSEWIPMYYHLDKNLNAVRNELGDTSASKLLEGMGYTGTDMRGDPSELKNSLLGATGIKVRKLDMDDQQQRKLVALKSEMLDRVRQMRRIQRDKSNPYRERDIAAQKEEIKRLKEKAQEIRKQ